MLCLEAQWYGATPLRSSHPIISWHQAGSCHPRPPSEFEQPRHLRPIAIVQIPAMLSTFPYFRQADISCPRQPQFVEIMAPVFSRNAWRCVWHMIQNDLVHGWGLDFTVRKCVEPAYEKMGVVDAQWIKHHRVPTLLNQGKGQSENSSSAAIRTRCRLEWKMFDERMAEAEKQYYKLMGLPLPSSNSTNTTK
ncbi:hypothetical protein FCM35_KLT18037 [Carex littledalei]|uniref:Uncharacterized protein n=1 Tax=Carex littledalei TaxID=544730 RepID=A0A833R2S5_9POAL|nr:hypothetical protein FCM35_KLT18037 [Carex littledalei]